MNLNSCWLSRFNKDGDNDWIASKTNQIYDIQQGIDNIICLPVSRDTYSGIIQSLSLLGSTNNGDIIKASSYTSTKELPTEVKDLAEPYIKAPRFTLSDCLNITNESCAPFFFCLWLFGLQAERTGKVINEDRIRLFLDMPEAVARCAAIYPTDDIKGEDSNSEQDICIDMTGWFITHNYKPMVFPTSDNTLAFVKKDAATKVASTVDEWENCKTVDSRIKYVNNILSSIYADNVSVLYNVHSSPDKLPDILPCKKSQLKRIWKNLLREKALSSGQKAAEELAQTSRFVNLNTKKT